MKTYYIRFNFLYFYKVVVDEKIVSIYSTGPNEEIDNDIDFPLVHSFSIEKVIEANKGCKYQEQDYNIEDTYCLLFKISNLKYIFISDKIYEFSACNLISELYSPIGNNDVPYSYAIDKDNNHYLMLENVILYNQDVREDPYKKYYKENSIVNYQKNIQYKDIIRCYMNGVEYHLRYNPYPRNMYNFWLSCPEICNGNLIMHYETNDGHNEIMTKRMYIKINNKFGKEKSFVPFYKFKLL